MSAEQTFTINEDWTLRKFNFAHVVSHKSSDVVIWCEVEINVDIFGSTKQSKFITLF